jgi:hypothetical protein
MHACLRAQYNTSWPKRGSSNAIYKQLPIVINGKFLALTVLVATSQINANCEVVMDYGSGFGKDIAEPMDLNSQEDDDEDEDDDDEDDEQ